MTLFSHFMNHTYFNFTAVFARLSQRCMQSIRFDKIRLHFFDGAAHSLLQHLLPDLP